MVATYRGRGRPRPQLHNRNQCFTSSFSLLTSSFGWVHWSTQAFTVLYQNCEFCGFRTQCPSSGKYIILEGTFCFCNAVKSWNPSETSRRKSSWPCETRVGVLKFLTELSGLSRS